MESIHATKDIGDHTVFGGSDVPPLGVVTEHQAELEKVISRKKITNFFISSSCSFPFPPIVIYFSVKSSFFKPKINNIQQRFHSTVKAITLIPRSNIIMKLPSTLYCM